MPDSMSPRLDWRERLPHLPPDLLGACNALVQPRAPWQLEVAQCMSHVQWHGAAAVEDAVGIYVACRIGTHAGHVFVPQALLEWLTPGSSADGRWHTLCGPALSLLVETAADELLAQLGERLGVPVTVDGHGRRPSACSEFSVSIMHAEEDACRHWLRIGLDASACHLIARHMASVRKPRQTAWDKLPMSLAISRGSQLLSLSEFSRISCGDVVIIDQPGYWACTVHGRRIFAVTPCGSRIRLDRLLFPDLEESAMDAGITSQETIVPVDQLLLTLVFELARIDLTLRELRECAVGTTLPLPAEPGDAVDIRINGQKVGQGRLVCMGEALGVQITRLHEHG